MLHWNYLSYNQRWKFVLQPTKIIFVWWHHSMGESLVAYWNSREVCS